MRPRSGMLISVLGAMAALAMAGVGQPAAKPVNRTCPISGKPVDASVQTTTHAGRTIGFCCPRCEAGFAAWDEGRRDAFVGKALASQGEALTARPAGQGTQPADEAKPGAADAKVGDPFPLDTCPVSGHALGEMGDPVVKVYDGREVRFCCESCIEEFEADPAKFWAEVDAKIIEQQAPYYPTEMCLVSNEPAAEHGEPIDYVYRNRLFRLCCNMCKKDLAKDPARVFAALDEAVKAKQRPEYPLQTCVVSDEELGSMGEPYEVVVANRLIRLCCKSCEKKVRKEPAAYLAKLDAALERGGR